MHIINTTAENISECTGYNMIALDISPNTIVPSDINNTIAMGMSMISSNIVNSFSQSFNVIFYSSSGSVGKLIPNPKGTSDVTQCLSCSASR